MWWQAGGERMLQVQTNNNTDAAKFKVVKIRSGLALNNQMVKGEEIGRRGKKDKPKA